MSIDNSSGMDQMFSIDKAQVKESEIKENPKLINILEMSEQERQKLTEKIEKTKGWAQMWVHTHYSEHAVESGGGYSTSEKAKEYTQYRGRMIKAHRGHTMPVIAFIEHEEGDDFLEKFEERYRTESDNQDPREIYYIETAKDDPVPYTGDIAEYYPAAYALLDKDAAQVTWGDAPTLARLSGKEVGTSTKQHDGSDPMGIDEKTWALIQKHFGPKLTNQYNEAKTKNWTELAEILKQFGLQHVLLRGRNYFERQEGEGITQINSWTTTSPLDEEIAQRQFQAGYDVAQIPSGCIGEAYKQLAHNGIPVRLSKLVYPQEVSPQNRNSQ